jgi:hypothetical protein
MHKETIKSSIIFVGVYSAIPIQVYSISIICWQYIRIHQEYYEINKKRSTKRNIKRIKERMQ